MKYTLCFITILLGSLLDLHANSENDSLLKVLDKVISERLVRFQSRKAVQLFLLASCVYRKERSYYQRAESEKERTEDIGRYVPSELRNPPPI